jgi:hypothetical protein
MIKTSDLVAPNCCGGVGQLVEKHLSIIDAAS